MTITILPSSPITSQAPSQSAFLPTSANSPRRPKLSLNTHATQNRVYGKGSTSLRLETLSAISPTVRNTFSNAYEAPQTPKAQRPQLSIDSTLSSTRTSSSESQSSDNAPTPSSSASSTFSASSVSSSGSVQLEVPYKVPHNLMSILSNSPLPKRPVRRRSFSTTRPMFPVTKHVSFRAPLTEEIRTFKYTMAHSDIEDSADSIASPPEAEMKSRSKPKLKRLSPLATHHSLALKTATDAAGDVTSPRAGEKRDSSDSDSDACPETPVAGRRKRQRNWVWTLGPINGSHPNPSSNDSEANDHDR